MHYNSLPVCQMPIARKRSVLWKIEGELPLIAGGMVVLWIGLLPAVSQGGERNGLSNLPQWES